MLNWGASAEDARKPLPGDELTPDDPIESTNAITIDAPAEEVKLHWGFGLPVLTYRPAACWASFRTITACDQHD